MCSWCARQPRSIDKPCGVTRGSLDELHRANVCRHFRDCLGTAPPNWPTAQRLETAPCCHLPPLEGPTLPLDRLPVSCPSEQPLAIAPVLVGRCPPDVLRAMQFRVPRTAFDPVNAEAKSDDGNGSFLLEQVLIAESSRGDDPGRGRRGAPDHLHRDDVLQHCPSTLAESVCRHARQFYVCVF